MCCSHIPIGGFMSGTIKMDNRGRITIPKRLREEYNINEDTEFLIKEISEDTFILKRIDLDELVEKVKKEIQELDIEEKHSKVEKEADTIVEEKYFSD